MRTPSPFRQSILHHAVCPLRRQRFFYLSGKKAVADGEKSSVGLGRSLLFPYICKYKQGVNLFYRRNATMMKDLMETLQAGNYSMVVLHDGKIRKYEGRGIDELYRLLRERPERLYEAKLAYKVLDKASAGLMVIGGVNDIYAGVMSKQAIPLLDEAGVRYMFDKLVDHITGADGEDWNDWERICAPHRNAEEVLIAVKQSMNRLYTPG